MSTLYFIWGIKLEDKKQVLYLQMQEEMIGVLGSNEMALTSLASLGRKL